VDGGWNKGRNTEPNQGATGCSPLPSRREGLWPRSGVLGVRVFMSVRPEPAEESQGEAGVATSPLPCAGEACPDAVGTRACPEPVEGVRGYQSEP